MLLGPKTRRQACVRLLVTLQDRPLWSGFRVTNTGHGGLCWPAPGALVCPSGVSSAQEVDGVQGTWVPVRGELPCQMKTVVGAK